LKNFPNLAAKPTLRAFSSEIRGFSLRRGYRVGYSADHQAESLGVSELADDVPESDVALSAFWGLDEDVLDLLA
jgi:hypothetical protein